MTLTTGRHAKRVYRRRPAGLRSVHAWKGRRDAGGTAGFTLLELVLVMLLVSLVMGLAAPSLRGFMLGRKSADAAAQVIALAQYARTQAVSTGSNYRLNVDPAAQTYWLTVQKGADFQGLGTEFGRRFSLPEHVSATWLPSAYTAHDYIEFFPDGRIEAAGLQLVDRERQVFEIGCRSETEPLTVLQRGSR
ncbi:MAG: GspH/FimT family pseudopilin [Planctomycetota bacterium]